MFDFLDGVDYKASIIVQEENPLKIAAIRNKLFKFIDEIDPFFNNVALKYSSLEKIHLKLSSNDILFFEDILKNNQKNIMNFSDNRKISVNYQGEDFDAKMSLHGQSSNHYKYRKKSFKLKFLNEFLPERFVSWRILIPDDRGYYSPFISNYVNSIIDLPIVDQSLKQVFINGLSYGIYYVEEKYDEKYLEKNRLSGVYVIDFDAKKVPYLERRNFNIDFIETIKLDDNFIISEEELSLIIEDFFIAIEENNEEKVLSYLDKEKTGAFEAWRNILGMQHDIENPNLRFVYIFSSGKFFPLPRLEGAIGRSGDLLKSNFFDMLDTSVDIINVRDLYLEKLIDKENDILQYYDDLNEEYYDLIMADHSISRGRRQRKRTIEQNREDIVYNFNIWKDYLNTKENFLDGIEEKNNTVEQVINVGPLSFYYNSSKNIYELLEGEYTIRENIHLSFDKKILFHPGVHVYMGPGVSFISDTEVDLLGTADNPILISASDPNKEFGVFAIQGVSEKNCKSNIVHTHVSGGSEAFVDGVYYTGALNVYYCDVVLRNSQIYNNTADDGLNVKYGNILITDNLFFNNTADQVDLDFCEGTVQKNLFEISDVDLDVNGDGLDVSGSKIITEGNQFYNFSDKGLSIGEKSLLLSKNDIFEKNNIGIAVKDLSNVYVDEMSVMDNMIDIDIYQKKQIFGGARVFFKDYIMNINIQKDEVSFCNWLDEDVFNKKIANELYVKN
ncbi:hypothetical protein KKG22_00325 [Patescibacteria group bacterium]|nr:hypothetical protein [Patescibacteria group bacterium]MBU1722121.1 hypothetical protein [Patescibacteria group bacterium]MBU1901170.1 hypothetical protein [Patescibacteria group bacterium]